VLSVTGKAPGSRRGSNASGHEKPSYHIQCGMGVGPRRGLSRACPDEGDMLAATTLHIDGGYAIVHLSNLLLLCLERSWELLGRPPCVAIFRSSTQGMLKLYKIHWGILSRRIDFGPR
jgi:hypothetical protein